MKQKANYLLLLVLQMAISSPGYSQNALFQTYKVVSLPKNSGYKITDINTELSAAKNKSDVARVLRSHKQLLSVPIVIRVKKSDKELYWWRINPGQIDKEGDFVIFQSKSNDANKFYSKNELRKYFKDTIVCFDTLKIEASLQNDDFRIEDYFFIINGTSTRISLPYDMHNKLLFAASLFNNDSLISGALYNNADSAQAITSCTLFFLDESIKSSLVGIAQDLKEEMPNTDIKTLAGYINSYIKNNYGVASFSDLIRFLDQNL